MDIYVVQPGDTIRTIAEKFGVPVQKLIQDNDLSGITKLTIGQSLIITYPKQEYTVQEGDTLTEIADLFQVSISQLLANNPSLTDREYIYPGETIIVSYNTKDSITTHGNTVPTISKSILAKTLPYLTYLSILNYTATDEGNIVSYYDDTEVIEITKNYGVAPLLLLTTTTIQGEANIRVAYDLLLNKEFQNNLIENLLHILKSKGYYGVNISFEYISISNLQLYEDYFRNLTNQLNKEGFEVFLTINPEIFMGEINYLKIDYSILNRLAKNIIFMTYEWSSRINPPAPISSYRELSDFLEYVVNVLSSDKIIIGIATIGYDWEMPFASGTSNVSSLTFGRVIELAQNVGATIKFDEVSQTPYFTYTSAKNIEHVVWFIDARSINASLELVSKYNLLGVSVWNISIFNPQLWLIIASQYEIEKVL